MNYKIESISVKKFILTSGWSLKSTPTAFILFTDDAQSKDEIALKLNMGDALSIKIISEQTKYCIGYNTFNGNRVPCPNNEVLSSNRVQCQSCSFNEFYICRAICQGDFCHPSSEDARNFCWNTDAFVYITSVAGKIKVGSSTNPLRRWLNQGSDAGISIAVGKGLEPRALEYHIGLDKKYKMAIRTNQKLKFLGSKINRESIQADITDALDEIYSNVKSNIMIPREKLEPITFLDSYYGSLNSLQSRPLEMKNDKAGLEVSGEIVGVKGDILVLKNVETYYAVNLNNLTGYFVELENKLETMTGQKSLFDFVNPKE
ncbi:MAG: DUF2797 domain-containing protein [Asgard group archaeon]|nr:DUF2797 domain-containing protein [Asgard group archaeon]